jgi:hypothetical protein
VTPRRHSRYVEQEYLSDAWTDALASLLDAGTDRLTPLVVSVTGFADDGTPKEDPSTRGLLDEALAARDLSVVHTVSNTVFPVRLWNRDRPRDELYSRYLGILPRVKRRPQNRYGLYFERLIEYDPGDPHSNQLEHIITTFESGVHRTSALQATIFDPHRDHTKARRRGFPCLQQVVFDSDRETESMSITAFYASQDIFAKAYGNYRGLCLLGAFVAHELRLRLNRMTCVSASAHLGEASKRSLYSLAAEARAIADSRRARPIGVVAL